MAGITVPRNFRLLEVGGKKDIYAAGRCMDGVWPLCGPGRAAKASAAPQGQTEAVQRLAIQLTGRSMTSRGCTRLLQQRGGKGAGVRHDCDVV